MLPTMAMGKPSARTQRDAAYAFKHDSIFLHCDLLSAGFRFAARMLRLNPEDSSRRTSEAFLLM
jgi:hypothetical protein